MKTSIMFGTLVLLSRTGIVFLYAVELVEQLMCPWYLPVSTDTKP